MVASALRRRRFDDNDEDLSQYDPTWLARGKKVVRDGGKVVVPVYLTDAAPRFPGFPAVPAFDASYRMSDAQAMTHRPHQARIVDGPARLAASDAREAYVAQLGDAWRGPDNQLAPEASDAESARAEYIKRLQNAWRAPSTGAAAIFRIGEDWRKPGATPGPGR
jgi:hypothetical protein